MRLLPPFFQHRLIWWALLLSLGIGSLFARAIWTIRHDEWNYARQTNTNLVRTLQHGVEWTLNSFDMSLEGVAREASRPEVWALPADLRARVMFDHSLRSRAMGDILILDATGKAVLNSVLTQRSEPQFADRDFFVAHAIGGHQGLFVGKPRQSSLTGRHVLPLSRAYHDTEGRFAGVVVGAIRLDYLNELFGSLELGASSGINLLRTDGVLIARFPYGNSDVGKSIAGTPNMARFQAESEGSFVGKAAIDGVERLYAFMKVGDFPIIVNVAQSTDTILAHWRRSAWMLGSFALVLMLACVGLAGRFVQELALRQKVSAMLQVAEHDLRTILHSVPSAIAYWDAQLHNRFANDAHREWFGAFPEALRNTHVSEFLGPELYRRNLPLIERTLQGEPQLFEHSFVDQGGATRHLIVSYQPDEVDGQVRGFFVQATDISERKRMEKELFDEKERARLSLQSIGDAVICTDADGALTYLNPAAERLTGWQAFDAAGRHVDDVVQLINPGTQAPMPSPLRQAMRTRMAVEAQRGEVVHRSSGQRFRVEETAAPITDRHGHVTGGVAVLRDVTEAMAMAERMAHLAHYDPLTDLPNRVLLQDRAQQALAQSRRDGKLLAVMYLDLDGFKQVNDTLGHDAGDVLLVHFAQRMKAAVRASDTVCRQGGDEFVVLLCGLDRVDDVCRVARKVLAACDEPFVLGDAPEVSVGLSGGIALYPEHGDTFDALSRHADSAMYAAKRAGRMRFMLYRGPDAQPRVILRSDAQPDGA
jgi:diguanylate cyclase (GGDEF)-like protein/PAS domain S-box-containing protein